MRAGRRRGHVGVLLGLLGLGLVGGGAAVATTDAIPPGLRQPGQTATRLPDGRWLLIGGDGPRGPSGDLVLYVPETGQTIRLAPTLATPRTG